MLSGVRGMEGSKERTAGRVKELSMKCSHIAAGVAVAALAAGAAANTVPFVVYENDNFADVSGLNLFVDITDAGNDKVTFRFENQSNNGAIITELYFENTVFSSGSLLGGSVSDSHSNVNFGDPESPHPSNKTPGGFSDIKWGDGPPPHNTTLYFAARDSGSGGIDNGIGMGEWLEVTFDVVGGVTASDIAAAMAKSLIDSYVADGFRIAQHVQSIGSNGDSVWTISYIPTPSAAFLGAAGLLVLARRRRNTL